MLSIYEEAQDLVNIGAYKAGSNPKIDWALTNLDAVQTFLRQSVAQHSPFDVTVAQLAKLLPK